MKSLILMVAFLLLLPCSLFAQTAPTTADQINSLWTQNKHDDLETLLNTKIAQTTPDIVALSCARTFFVLVKPNRTKALQSATKLKQLADASQKADLITITGDQLTGMQSFSSTESPAPSAAALTKLHTSFADKYPAIDFALRLEKRFNMP